MTSLAADDVSGATNIPAESAQTFGWSTSSAKSEGLPGEKKYEGVPSGQLNYEADNKPVSGRRGYDDAASGGGDRRCA
jgi:hypothetical protein